MLVPIIMGSKSDLEHGQQVAAALARFGIPAELRVASAHKAPAYLFDMLRTYEADPRPKVYVTIAGRSNALSAVVDTQVVAPVIACPPYSDRFAGADVYSSLRMPSGVAPVVVIDPDGAALAAAKILALNDPGLAAQVRAHQERMEAQVMEQDQSLGRPS